MAARLGCESADGALGHHKIAAVAPVSGGPVSESGDIHELFSCPALMSDPVPMRMIVSNNDTTVAGLVGLPASAVTDTFRLIAHQWASQSGSAGFPSDVLTGRTGWGVLAETVTYRSLSDPLGRRDVVLDIFDTGGPDRDGHLWPGSWWQTEYRATDVIWSFFKAHPRP